MTKYQRNLLTYHMNRKNISGSADDWVCPTIPFQMKCNIIKSHQNANRNAIRNYRHFALHIFGNVVSGSHCCSLKVGKLHSDVSLAKAGQLVELLFLNNTQIFLLVSFVKYRATALIFVGSCVSLGSPCGSEVHEKVTVVDPRHPDQLLFLGHGLATRGGERLQLWELGLIRSAEKERDRWCHTANSSQAWRKYQLSTPCHRVFAVWLSGGGGDKLQSQWFNILTHKYATLMTLSLLWIRCTRLFAYDLLLKERCDFLKCLCFFTVAFDMSVRQWECLHAQSSRATVTARLRHLTGPQSSNRYTCRIKLLA